MIDAFAELTLETRDAGLLERFYREAFGFDALARDEDRIWLGWGSGRGWACGRRARRNSETRVGATCTSR
jgi:hypothetical protein